TAGRVAIGVEGRGRRAVGGAAVRTLDGDAGPGAADRRRPAGTGWGGRRVVGAGGAAEAAGRGEPGAVVHGVCVRRALCDRPDQTRAGARLAGRGFPPHAGGDRNRGGAAGGMEHLSGFAPLAERYQGFILDLWGVIHDGVHAFPEAVDTLEQLRAMGRRTLLLSNAPRPNETVQQMMRGMGIPDALYTAILTSGEAVRRSLRDPPDAWWSSLGRRVLLLGTERDRPVLDGLDYSIVDAPEDADFVLNAGPYETHGY